MRMFWAAQDAAQLTTRSASTRGTKVPAKQSKMANTKTKTKTKSKANASLDLAESLLDTEIDKLFGGAGGGSLQPMQHKGDPAVLYDGIAMVGGTKCLFYFDDGSNEATATMALIHEMNKDGADIKLHHFPPGTE